MGPKTRKDGSMPAEQAVAAYRAMLLSRTVDDKEIQLKRQNLAFFQINGAGHEGILVAAAQHLDPDRDWFFTYYRDRALALAAGLSPYEMFLGSIGAEAGPDSRGRQMPSHWGKRDAHLVTSSSPTGTQCLHGVGFAEAGRYLNGAEEAGEAAADGEVVFVSLGDGTSSEGEFWESLNTACSKRLPILYLIEDNGWAISVPVAVQTPGGSISGVVSGFPGLTVLRVDGCDYLESYRVMEEAVSVVRRGDGPVLVHADLVRPYSHSLSDDERMYKPEKVREEEAQRDPLVHMRRLLLDHFNVAADEIEALEASVRAEVNEAADRALEMPQPDPGEWALNIYSPSVDPTSDAFSTAPRFDQDGGEKTMVDLLNACLRDEMARDDRIVVFGEDVADCSVDEYMDSVKGKGGVFKVTFGLQRQYGSERVFNSPLAEANIIGRAVGMAMRGLKPVVEIQFFDYIWPAYQQLRNELATVRWRSGGAWSSPAVVRVPVGGYLKGGGPYHSQSGAVLFSHVPGLRVVMPSNALDANGLLRTAIRSDDPVVFLEHKHLYRQTHNKSRYPGDDFMIPFGRASIVNPGDDVTVITYGATVVRSLSAAKRVAEAGGASVEILDLRTLSPYDWDAVAASVKKTGRALVVYEDPVSFGYGAEIAARIADELFPWLDAPVRRVGARDTFVAYAPKLEEVILPQPTDIQAAIEDLLRF